MCIFTPISGPIRAISKEELETALDLDSVPLK
jgi:hypothetical protein